MSITFITTAELAAQIRSRKLVIESLEKFVVVQLDRRGRLHYQSKEAIGIALEEARQGKRVILFGLCPLRDYQKDSRWQELTSYQKVSFAPDIPKVCALLQTT